MHADMRYCTLQICAVVLLLSESRAVINDLKRRDSQIQYMKCDHCGVKRLIFYSEYFGT